MSNPQINQVNQQSINDPNLDVKEIQKALGDEVNERKPNQQQINDQIPVLEKVETQKDDSNDIEVDIQAKYQKLEDQYGNLQSLFVQFQNETSKLLQDQSDNINKQQLQSIIQKINESQKQLNNQNQVSRQDKDYFYGQSKNTNSYDVLISINSMYDLSNKQCKIEYFEKPNKTKEIIDSQQKCSIIGFQGVKNRGKTFLLNQLSDEKFPSAFYESTLGISAKVDIKDSSTKIYLDSEGVQKPAKFNWNDAYKSKNKNSRNEEDEAKFLSQMQEQVIQSFFDIKATEQLQQEFLLQSCEIVIIVVGMLSIEDQKLISSIIDRKLSCQIIVVHNYKEIKEIKHVQDHIEHSLMYQFPLAIHSPDLKLKTNKEHNKIAYIDRRYKNVVHIIFANNKSEAGDYFNQFSLEYIRQKIQLHSRNKSFCISERFTKFLNDYLPNYIEFVDQPKTFDKTLVKKEANNNEFIISLSENLKINRIKDITLDVFGRIINAINYTVVEFDKNNQKYKRIDIELPGNTYFENDNCLVQTDDKGRTQLVIKALKKLDQTVQGTIILEDKRLYGEFILKVIIGKPEEKLTQVGKIINNNNGVHSILFLNESSEQDCLGDDDDNNV
ncbi:hypothetical protein TTHERM_00836660 (macronuclear) [Tetrahymena thermophila SB210]|uniref:50S ribosome-binding GTPase n=1 Tax=Tetrahymena thermophila (strain SB210) TaxID=312017 RepID=I7MMJ8_TETTS|nr:hypothetical protein TTHERM_00836660 [Tetrahymena thermophila SB210]EAS04994.1 hypothetical protein TTHERM_00836660 [Tetrahymena thermophila SB210]|eukprot:XP_001025239.1 hypothetical protein TTHERM_00836660 [Tetrahymena thermophila SB210]